MDPSWVFWEGEHSLSCKKTVGGWPFPQWVWCARQKIVSDGFNIEIPSVWSVSLSKIALNQASPLRALNLVLEISSNRLEASCEVKILDWLDISTDLSCCFEVILVHGGWIDTEITSWLVQVIAGRGEGDFASQTVTSESGHGNLMFIHESCGIIWILNNKLPAISCQLNSLVWSEVPKFLG